MFPEHLQAGWWEKPSRNRDNHRRKVTSECQTKACQTELLIAPHTCPVIFLPLLLCTRGLKWPPSTPFSMSSANYPSRPGSNFIFMKLSPYIKLPTLHLHVVSPSLIFPKITFWHLLLLYYLSQLVSFQFTLFLGIHHLLPKMLQLILSNLPVTSFSRQLSKIQTTPMI